MEEAARALGIPTTSDFRTNFHQYSRYYGLGWLSPVVCDYLRRFHNQALRDHRLELVEDDINRVDLLPLVASNHAVGQRGNRRVDDRSPGEVRRELRYGAAVQDAGPLQVAGP